MEWEKSLRTLWQDRGFPLIKSSRGTCLFSPLDTSIWLEGQEKDARRRHSPTPWTGGRQLAMVTGPKDGKIQEENSFDKPSDQTKIKTARQEYG